MDNKNNKIPKIKISRVILISLLALFLISLGLTIRLLLNIPEWKPSDFETEMSSTIFDIQENKITALHNSENRTPISLDLMPSYLIDAFISTEDTRFFEHPGVDIIRIAGAVLTDIKDMGFSQGASTITMQLARNAILESQEKKLDRKIQEALLALQIERQYTKEEILQYYLNEIYFGHGANGVQAASQTYFGKEAIDLTLGEAAILAGLVRNPRMYSPFLNPENALKIRSVVLDNMVRYDKISSYQAVKAKNESLDLATLNKKEAFLYPWFTDYVIDEAEDLLAENGYESGQLYTGGFKIHTTLDPEIQEAAEEAYSDSNNFPENNTANPIQSAMAIIDPKTGGIKALIGGREYITRRGLNRATSMQRQPGSTIKPIAVYGPAIEKGYSANSILDDSPVVFGSGKNAYSPKNYDGKYRGRITIREAVRLSVNVPAVKLLSEIGVNEGYNFARALGFPLLPNDKNLALSLGGLSKGVSPLNMAAAYAAFDNQGVYIEPHAITKILDHNGNTIIDVKPNRRIVMKEETAQQITSILRTVIESGTGTRAKLSRPAAGKTGTTQIPSNVTGSRNITGAMDTWFAGYTPELVGVVWIGYDKLYDENGNLQYLQQGQNTGGKYPALIWKTVMEQALKNAPIKNFKGAGGIVYKNSNVTDKTNSKENIDELINNEATEKPQDETEAADAFVTVTIDPETGLLANDNCPIKVTKTFSPEEVPTVYCNIHNSTTDDDNNTIHEKPNEEVKPNAPENTQGENNAKSSNETIEEDILNEDKTPNEINSETPNEFTDNKTE